MLYCYSGSDMADSDSSDAPDHDLEYSSVLFVNEDGSPMQFYMRPCREKARIKKLVQVCIK